MLRFEEARRVILDSVKPVGSEEAPILEAGGRIIAETLKAPWAMPQWNNSAMDGFAVRSEECLPSVELKVTGYIPAGKTGEGPSGTMTAVRIMTGAPIPDGADAIVPVEDVEERGETIRLGRPVKTGQHIRFRGEDVAEGESIIRAGALLRPAEIGMLASFGKTSLPVFRKVRVAILSTGDELVDPGTTPGQGQIINSNTYALAAAIREIGAEPVVLGIARDDRQSHRDLLAKGLEADVLITSAGVSAGDRDLVRDVLTELGVRQVFWKINIKPGRPTAFALKEDTPVFSLPGNPVSTMITFEELVRPALLKMMGHKTLFRPLFTARLKEDVKKTEGRLHFLRVAIERQDGIVWARTSGDQNTGIMKTMLRADALALLPEERRTIYAGEDVNVHLV